MCHLLTLQAGSRHQLKSLLLLTRFVFLLRVMQLHLFIRYFWNFGAWHIGHGDEWITRDSKSQSSSPCKVNDLTSNKIVRKKQQPRAACWNHFSKFVTEGGENRARCIHCDNTYSMEIEGSTTNLNNHLKTCLKEPQGNIVDLKQSELAFAKTTSDPESETTTLSTWKFDANAIRKALIHMIIVDELPFRIVDGEGFKVFLSIACPRYHLPSRYTVRRDCLNLFKSMKRSMKNSFGKDTSKICLTTDTWTSLQRVSYMVLTAHWIEDEWMLQKRIINFFLISAHRGVKYASIYVDQVRTAVKYIRASPSRMKKFGVSLLFPSVENEVVNMIEKELRCLFDEYSSISGRGDRLIFYILEGLFQHLVLVNVC
ncbi:hypothetical protein V6N13_034191 [Hibiscus sabdariffa]